jgi:hypothetical protein
LNRCREGRAIGERNYGGLTSMGRLGILDKMISTPSAFGSVGNCDRNQDCGPYYGVDKNMRGPGLKNWVMTWV